MNILMICTEKLPVPPVLGGAIQTYIAGILPYLSKKHQITVLGTNHHTLPEDEIIDGVRYARIPGKLFEVYKEGVSRFVAANSFDLIHIFNRPRLILPVRQNAPQTKITLSMHNDMFFPEKMDPEEAEMAIKETSKIVTVSDYIGNVIKNLFPESATKIKTIYSGVDIDRFLPKNHPEMVKTRNSLLRAHGLEDKKVILFAGRLSRNKGVDKLVRAMAPLSKEFKNLALVIMGGNWFSENKVTDYVAYVRALAKRSPVPIITTGFISPDKIHEWFGAADLFVCTSVWQEPLARVHYEAMASGLPIVTTARGGNPEVILPMENGVVVDNPEDPNSFAVTIAKVLSNSALMTKMGSTGRDLALKNYTWKRVAEDVLNVWNSVNEGLIEESVTNTLNPVSNVNIELNDMESFGKWDHFEESSDDPLLTNRRQSIIGQSDKRQRLLHLLTTLKELTPSISKENTANSLSDSLNQILGNKAIKQSSPNLIQPSNKRNRNYLKTKPDKRNKKDSKLLDLIKDINMTINQNKKINE
ncbi:glycosyltransferase family 4 protein [Bacillus sp. 31A1R]|uniref:Glycosyltransferase family 4 protein n=1 Tax=Robertmurraya mangrovi TaxID=3098077 RepID=A0ABU5J2Q1_9BACI|nr:glycosyltransferase family 4 protein [Bacillus sp. 31A1R]MDZ5473691.1 glycosyltransferase family 4 protein [Bacillus sp. 31A1R]